MQDVNNREQEEGGAGEGYMGTLCTFQQYFYKSKCLKKVY